MKDSLMSCLEMTLTGIVNELILEGKLKFMRKATKFSSSLPFKVSFIHYLFQQKLAQEQ